MKAIKAIMVVARRLLKVVYKHISRKTVYEENGWERFFELQQKNALINKARPVVI